MKRFRINEKAAVADEIFSQIIYFLKEDLPAAAA